MALVATAQDAKENETLSVPMGNILLKPPASAEATTTPSELPHAIHFSYNCRECHHTWNFGSQILSCTASGCHDLAKPPKDESGAVAVADIRYFKNAFHQNCIGCHLEIKKQNAILEKSPRLSAGNLVLQKSGPTGCIECHPKD